MQKEQDSESPSKLETSRTPDFVGEDKSKACPAKYRGRVRLFLVVTVLVIILDQLTKLWIHANQPQIQLLPGFLDLHYVENTRAIFGLLQTRPEVIIALGIAGVIVVLLFIHYFPPLTTLGTVSFALILSGAVGNLIDRIRFGYAIDFISMHLRDLFQWPAFNVADIALTVGIFAFIYYFYKSGIFRKAYERDGKPQD
jgi:signal peptidase II